MDAGDNGMFFLNSNLRYDDVSDGSSHTIFIGEKIPDGWDLHWMSGTRATLRNAGSPINTMSFKTGLPRPRTPEEISPDSDAENATTEPVLNPEPASSTP